MSFLKELKEDIGQAMNELINAIDNLPWIVKIILCLPGVDIVWAIYRIIKGIEKKDTLLLVVGIVWIVFGTTLTWLWDLITTILYKHPKLA